MVCQRARGCTYMAEPHVALGESWQVHLYGEAARFFFFFPAPIWGSHSQELGSSTAIRIGMWHDKSTNEKGGWQGEVGRCTYMVKPPGVFPERFIRAVGEGEPGRCT